MALVSMLFEARRAPSSRHGMMTGQGNLVEAKAIWKKPGRTIAATQRSVFHFSMCFRSEVVIRHAGAEVAECDAFQRWMQETPDGIIL